jgi:hypothetical protein
MKLLPIQTFVAAYSLGGRPVAGRWIGVEYTESILRHMSSQKTPGTSVRTNFRFG